MVPKSSNATLKSIFEYDNYRDFLKDAYVHSKEKNKNFSFRYFSRIAGFKSPNILKLVMDGDRNLAPESAEKFALAFKLNKEETYFFRNLVHLNQAGTAEEKQKFAGELLKSRVYRKINPLKESQYNYLGQWYFVLIRELVGLPGFKEDYDWISKQILYPISATDTKRAMEELIKLGLVERDGTGKLVQTAVNVGTPDEVTSSSAAKCLRDLMNRASESIDIVPRSKRDISAITFTLSESAATQIKEKIQKFRKEILEIVSRDGNHDSVYQLNFQFFPMAKIPGTAEDK